MTKKTIFYIVLGIFLVRPGFLPAQTAAELEELLENPAVSYSLAAWFVQGSVGYQGIDSPEMAFNWAMARGFLPKNAAPDNPIKLGSLSFLIMRAFDMRGGIMYSIFSNPHYAYRELVYRDIIQGRAAANMAVPGEMLLFLVNRTLAINEQ